MQIKIWNIILMIVLFIFALAFPYNVQADITATEREALIALYDSTDGDNWNNNSGWKETPLHTDGFAAPGTEDDWYGVGVSSDTAVTSISLSSNELDGTIPSELGNLTNLQNLYLSSNLITGSIPIELGNLEHLKILWLHDNHITGKIPSELGNLTSLERLYLYSNQLTGNMPSELGDLNNLQHLILYDNQLTGSIPKELGNLEYIVRLYLYNNELTGKIPGELMNLNYLTDLDICNNHLYAIDSELIDFLDNLQPGWDECQTPPFSKPMPWIPLLLLSD